jgi:hypothetical protein
MRGHRGLEVRRINAHALPTADCDRRRHSTGAFWGLWSIVQYANDNPATDFWTYALNRFEHCKMLMRSAEFDHCLNAVRTSCENKLLERLLSTRRLKDMTRERD